MYIMFPWCMLSFFLSSMWIILLLYVLEDVCLSIDTCFPHFVLPWECTLCYIAPHTRYIMSLSLLPPPIADEVLTCSVCDRAFMTARQLIVHQNNRKHFGCSQCDVTFSCVQDLRDHKDKVDHWSDPEDEAVQETLRDSSTRHCHGSDERRDCSSDANGPLDDHRETPEASHCHRGYDQVAHHVANEQQYECCIDNKNLTLSLTEMERLLWNNIWLIHTFGTIGGVTAVTYTITWSISLDTR